MDLFSFVSSVSFSYVFLTAFFLFSQTSALPFFHRPLAKLVTAFNQNTVKLETSSLVSSLEREAVAKLHRLIFAQDDQFYHDFTHSPEVSLGTVTSGGTVANLTGLWVARNRALGPRAGFAGVEEAGLHRALRHYQLDDAVIIGSQLLHYSFKKAADTLGVGTSGLLTVPYDDEFRVRVDLMEERILECQRNNTLVLALVGVAGATETGSVDDLEALAALARKYRIHFHVDAAWGGPLVFSKKYRGLMNGIHLADSVTIDGHKQLYTPMGCGVILFRDPTAPQSIKKTSNYIIRNDSLDAGKFSVEGSRPANALYLHASLSVLGSEGFEALIDRNCAMARVFAARLADRPEFELVAAPTSNILLYRWIPEEFRAKWRMGELGQADNEAINAANHALQAKVCREGESFVSRTSIFSNVYGVVISVLRVVIANPNTQQEHLDFALNEQRRLIDTL